ncbi:MAG: NifB/NifX family molybdenum-iron cluster-binding protein [bacterium]|nr:NifB/NifX family molybdenum-iron cluster-binding protein [bacterium]
MKIAVATEGGRVAPHFGRCSEYTLIGVQDGVITASTIVPNPGHQPGFLPGYLARLGVTCIMAGGMGPRAKELFAREGIEALVGVTGPVDMAVRSYLAGALETGETLCEHGEEVTGCPDSTGPDLREEDR